MCSGPKQKRLLLGDFRGISGSSLMNALQAKAELEKAKLILEQKKTNQTK